MIITTDIQDIAAEYGLALTIPPEVSAKAVTVSQPNYRKLINNGRRDLTKLDLVTIDGEDARDFDDAVHCHINDRGEFILTIVIADVAAFTNAGDELDQEAAMRGTSVYFPGLVLPMLPPQLSEDLCSLLPGKERLGLACEVLLDQIGQVLSYSFFECVICSAQRLTYAQAEIMLASSTSNDGVKRSLDYLAQLAAILTAKRKESGAMFLEMPNIVPVVNNGVVSGCKQEYRLSTHRIIEECMLIANTCAADFLTKHNYPFLYRIHAHPVPDKVMRLRNVLSMFGIKVPNLKAARGIQKVVDSLVGCPTLVIRVLALNILRAIERAEYSTNNIGHYGLANPSYTHFTSPIRRYPDLLVHRAIKDVLKQKQPPKGLLEDLTEIGRYCTAKELAAERAVFDVIGRQLGRTLAYKTGQIINGVISGMVRRGMFVIFEEGAEGMVRFTTMADDYYALNDTLTKATGRRNGSVYYVGQEVSVRIVDVNDVNGRCALKMI